MMIDTEHKHGQVVTFTYRIPRNPMHYSGPGAYEGPQGPKAYPSYSTTVAAAVRARTMFLEEWKPVHWHLDHIHTAIDCFTVTFTGIIESGEWASDEE